MNRKLPSHPLRLGTRASKLALAQAHLTRTTIARHHGLHERDIEIVALTTSGDKHLEGRLIELGGKGLFTKEIEEALLAGIVDIAVHSMKDVATRMPDGLVIPAILPREDPRDMLITREGGSLNDLPQGGRFGTASLRRAAQISHMRPDLEIIPFRGNVLSRLEKLRAGDVDATLLAVAGLNRLQLTPEYAIILDTAELLPAVAQGAIGLQCRQNDAEMVDFLQAISHQESACCVAAERAMLAVLDGSCRTPIAGYATLDSDILTLTGLIALPDGSALHRFEAQGPAEFPKTLGEKVANTLIKRAGTAFMKAVHGE